MAKACWRPIIAAMNIGMGSSFVVVFVCVCEREYDWIHRMQTVHQTLWEHEPQCFQHKQKMQEKKSFSLTFGVKIDFSISLGKAR
jgi:hypothetical protein